MNDEDKQQVELLINSYLDLRFKRSATKSLLELNPELDETGKEYLEAKQKYYHNIHNICLRNCPFQFTYTYNNRLYLFILNEFLSPGTIQLFRGLSDMPWYQS
jgi:hypothetical protein